MAKQPQPAPTASAVGPCPTVSKIVGRPGTGSLPSTFAPPDHSRRKSRERIEECEKMSKLPPPAPTSSANRPLPYYHPNCRTGSSPRAIAPPDHTQKWHELYSDITTSIDLC